MSNDLLPQCTTGYGMWDNFDFPTLNPHRQPCKYGPHLTYLLFIFLSLQLSVALSRVRDPANIKVLNFTPLKCPPQPPEVLNHARPHGVDVPVDIQTCCHRPIQAEADPLDKPITSPIESDDDVPSEFNDSDPNWEKNLIEAVNDVDELALRDLDARLDFSGEPENLPFTPDIKDLIINTFKCCLDKHNLTATKMLGKVQVEIEHLIGKDGQLERLLQYSWNCIAQIYEAAFPNFPNDEREPTDMQTSFESKFHSWFETEFFKALIVAFKTRKLSTPQSIAGTKLAQILKNQLHEHVLKRITEGKHGEPDPPKDITPESLKSLRNLAGRAIAVTRKSIKAQMDSRLQDGKDAEDHLNALALLQQLCRPFHQLDGNDDSLEMVERRMNRSRGLTHISNEAFDVFKELETVRRQNLTKDKLREQKDMILEHCKNSCMNNTTVKEKWNVCLKPPQVVGVAGNTSQQDKEEFEMMKENLLRSVISRYLGVADNAYRKSIEEALNVKKELTHRSSVRVDDVLPKEAKKQRTKRGARRAGSDSDSESSSHTLSGDAQPMDTSAVDSLSEPEETCSAIAQHLSQPQTTRSGRISKPPTLYGDFQVPESTTECDTDDETANPDSCKDCNRDIIPRASDIESQLLKCSACHSKFHVGCQEKRFFWSDFRKYRKNGYWLCSTCKPVVKRR